MLFSDVVLTAFVYVSTVVATLRAGSRALYLIGHEGRIGVMDGPLILGPDDIARRSDAVGDREGEADTLEAEGSSLTVPSVSPLWESAYGFQQAVKLSFSANGVNNANDKDGGCQAIAEKVGSTDTNTDGIKSVASNDESKQKNKSSKALKKGAAKKAKESHLSLKPSSDDSKGVYYSMAYPHRSSPPNSFSLPLSSARARSDVTKKGIEIEIDGKPLDNFIRDELVRRGVQQAILQEMLRRSSGTFLSQLEVKKSENLDGKKVENPLDSEIETNQSDSREVQDLGNTSMSTLGDLKDEVNSLPSASVSMEVPLSTSNFLSKWKGIWQHLIPRHDKERKLNVWESLRRSAGTYEGSRDFDKKDYETVLYDTVPVPDVTTVMYNDCGDKGGDKGRPEVLSRKGRVAHLKAYAPQTFARLRSRFGVKENDFVHSIMGNGPYVSFQSNSKGAARAGGFFFFTRDGAYMIKTIKKAEVSALLKMLPKYDRYMKRNARRSLLTRFCGMYGVRISDSSTEARGSGIVAKMLCRKEEEQVFIVMNSVFPVDGSKFISERFDLKGSTVGRECSLKEREEKGSNAVLKDLDLAKEIQLMHVLPTSSNIPKFGISIGARGKSKLLSQLRRDVGLLEDCGVMDYSLLVGVVNMEGPVNTSDALTPVTDKMQSRDSFSNYRHKRKILHLLGYPIRHLIAPPIYLGKKFYGVVEMTLSSIITLPLPYYGAGICGVDGGALSVMHGKRFNQRAVYYLGIIDFLQPWTYKKFLERELRGVLGYDTKAISCVHPKDYASRFLDFIDDVTI